MWKPLIKICSSKGTLPFLFILFLCAVLWLMQLRLERSQRNLAQKEEEYRIVLSANKKQQENINRLIQEQKKQEKLLLQTEREKQNLVHTYRTKQAQVYKRNDQKSAEWKQTEIPEPVLQLLKEKKDYR